MKNIESLVVARTNSCLWLSHSLLLLWDYLTLAFHLSHVFPGSARSGYATTISTWKRKAIYECSLRVSDRAADCIGIMITWSIVVLISILLFPFTYIHISLTPERYSNCYLFCLLPHCLNTKNMNVDVYLRPQVKMDSATLAVFCTPECHLLNNNNTSSGIASFWVLLLPLYTGERILVLLTRNWFTSRRAV